MNPIEDQLKNIKKDRDQWYDRWRCKVAEKERLSKQLDHYMVVALVLALVAIFEFLYILGSAAQ